MNNLIKLKMKKKTKPENLNFWISSIGLNYIKKSLKHNKNVDGKRQQSF